MYAYIYKYITTGVLSDIGLMTEVYEDFCSNYYYFNIIICCLVQCYFNFTNIIGVPLNKTKSEPF